MESVNCFIHVVQDSQPITYSHRTFANIRLLYCRCLPRVSIFTQGYLEKRRLKEVHSIVLSLKFWDNAKEVEVRCESFTEVIKMVDG